MLICVPKWFSIIGWGVFWTQARFSWFRVCSIVAVLILSTADRVLRTDWNVPFADFLLFIFLFHFSGVRQLYLFIVLHVFLWRLGILLHSSPISFIEDRSPANPELLREYCLHSSWLESHVFCLFVLFFSGDLNWVLVFHSKSFHWAVSLKLFWLLTVCSVCILTLVFGSYPLMVLYLFICKLTLCYLSYVLLKIIFINWLIVCASIYERLEARGQLGRICFLLPLGRL